METGDIATEVARTMIISGKEISLRRSGVAFEGGRLVFHSLRNTYVSLLLESGASVKEVQDLTRHSSPELTMGTYSRSRW
jgi:integrase